MPRTRTGFPLPKAPAMLLAALLAAGAAQAQTAAYEEIARLLRSDQPADAQRRAESQLKDRPADPQLRFLKGIAQAHQGRAADAAATYSALIADYPELPEPHNNLAVIRAEQGKLDEARAELEAAIRLSPDYATAQQNLGDVHARLARRAWARALELDPANPGLRPRLQLIDQLPLQAGAR